jgi:hypothetical protein
MAFTVFIAGLRQRKPVDNNWPFIYWVLVVMFTLSRPEETYNFNIVLLGLGMGMMLRFEFMNSSFVKLVGYIELAVMGYILYRGFTIITT